MVSSRPPSSADHTAITQEVPQKAHPLPRSPPEPADPPVVPSAHRQHNQIVSAPPPTPLTTQQCKEAPLAADKAAYLTAVHRCALRPHSAVFGRIFAA
ncbi:hypothetical protein PMAC_000399 [Pneumocystis sp. 'macacae']|nr:hypothetical protein PMAC_000399 [Pneumocystis sp. 'macacae']